MKLTTMAWRNIRRNGRRTALSASAIAVAAMTIVLLFSLIQGMTEDMAFNLKHFYMGEIRVRHSEYDKNAHLNPLHLSIENASEVMEEIRAGGDFVNVSGRIQFPTGVFQDGETTPLIGMGIDFENDMMRVADFLSEGSLPSAGSTEVLLGSRAAENLGIGVGDKFTAVSTTLRRASNGMTFTVAGIGKFPLNDIDSQFYLPLETAQRFLRTGDRAVDLILQSAPGVSAQDARDAVARILSARGLTDIEAEIWNDIPSSYIFLVIARTAYYIMGMVFYVLASTVIINTIMMTIFERTKEIGTLASMGMDGRDIVKMFFLESMFISAIGSVIGALAGGGISLILGQTGIDLTAALEGVDFEISGVVYTKLKAFHVIFAAISGVIVASSISLLPSRQASKIKPVEAMKSY
jgi:putative ABC transport system permease protein